MTQAPPLENATHVPATPLGTSRRDPNLRIPNAHPDILLSHLPDEWQSPLPFPLQLLWLIAGCSPIREASDRFPQAISTTAGQETVAYRGRGKDFLFMAGVTV